MPYPRAHTYVTWFGDGWGGQEIWQVGLRLDGTDTPLTMQLEGLDAAMATLLGDPGVGFPTACRYLGLKVAPQDVNGRYPDGSDAVEYLRPSPLTGSWTEGYPQIALVISWRTARSRGYASNGRMYLPSANKPASSTGRIPPAEADSAATAGAAFIAAVNSADLGAASVMSTVGAGRIEAITDVRVGGVMDTQRRRRNQITEEYSTPVPVPS